MISARKWERHVRLGTSVAAEFQKPESEPVRSLLRVSLSASGQNDLNGWVFGKLGGVLLRGCESPSQTVVQHAPQVANKHREVFGSLHLPCGADQILCFAARLFVSDKRLLSQLKESPMPTYEYECEKCRHRFVKAQTFAEHDQHRKIKCPKCGSQIVQQLIASVHVKTAKKS